jgi:hypothetical protein
LEKLEKPNGPQMNRFLPIAIALLPLTACQYTEYYAEGRTVAQRTLDYANCESAAYYDHPEQRVTRYRPRVYVPETETCDAEGTCVTTEGYWQGGEAYTVDLAQSRRGTAIAACMAERGYTEVSLPICPASRRVAASTVMAPLSDSTCLIRTDNGALIVNP